MSAIVGRRVSLGQENGPDVELVVTGTEREASYATPDGYAAVYDDSRGLYCFARLLHGRLESTGEAVTGLPPLGAERVVPG